MREIFRGRIISLRQDQVVLPTGGTVILDLVHHPGAAAIVAVDESGAVALIHQFRHAAGGFIWEVPAGTLMPGESPDVCADRSGAIVEIVVTPAPVLSLFLLAIVTLLLGAVLTAAAVAVPALAVGGVIEINQAGVLAGNITPGDTPGFPATLSLGGSHRLTGLCT